MDKIKLIRDLYVVVPQSRGLPSYNSYKFNTNAGPAILSFMVPDGAHAAAQKRKENARNWGHITYWDNAIDRYEECEPKTCTYSNTPQRMEIVGYASRMDTSNKWVQIADPRGFVLEITIENMLYIMQNTVIDKGMIQSECVWARNRANNYLVPLGTELHQELLTKPVAV